VRDGAQLIFENRFGIVQQASDERALPIIHAPRGDKSQQSGVIE
jgi:hypothetical protein